MNSAVTLGAAEASAGAHPPTHWAVLRRFAEGLERDPKNFFNLAEDVWDARAYASNVFPPHAKKYEFSFTNLRSWIKPYVKLYCYERLMGRKGEHSSRDAKIAYHLTRADQFIIERNLTSLDDFANPVLFEALWKAQLISPGDEGKVRLTADAVRVQKRTRAFWLYISSIFGVPFYVPPVAPHTERPVSDSGADKSKLIPDAVVRQLVNILALHRDGIALLNRYNHLRLCVLLLLTCVGRRIEEVLAAPRGKGPDGPLERYPRRLADQETSGEALWFRIAPNKKGRSDLVFISPEWEDLATYCIRQLIAYGDEVRGSAHPDEQSLLILVSDTNMTASDDMTVQRTAGGVAKTGCHLSAARAKAVVHADKSATARGIAFDQFNRWLNGSERTKRGERVHSPGFMDKWHVTRDGSLGSEIFHLSTLYARHTRQSVLAGDHRVTPTSRSHDLNHNGRDAQFNYQHVLDEENSALTTKVTNGSLSGRSMKSLDELLGIPREESAGGSRPALVTILSPRLEALIENNPAYFERNRVRLGVCGDSEGRDRCELYKVSPKSRKSRSKSESARKSSTVDRDRNEGKGANSSNFPLSGSSITGSQGSSEDVYATGAVINRLKNRIEAIREDEL